MSIFIPEIEANFSQIRECYDLYCAYLAFLQLRRSDHECLTRLCHHGATYRDKLK